MIILGVFIWLPVRAVGLAGVLLIVGHDMLTTLKLPPNSMEDMLMKIFFTAKGTLLPLDHNHFAFILYAILPWTGVMMLGYAFGSLYKADYQPASRKAFLLYSSLTLFAAFIILRVANGYGDPAPWSVQKNGVLP